MLSPGDLRVLAPRLIEAVGRFGSQDKAERLRKLLARFEPMEAPIRSLIPKPRKVPELGAFSQQVLVELERLSPLAWSLLEAQCSRAGLDAVNLTPSDLMQVMPAVEKSLARFTSPDRAGRARAAPRSTSMPRRWLAPPLHEVDRLLVHRPRPGFALSLGIAAHFRSIARSPEVQHLLLLEGDAETIGLIDAEHLAE